MYDPNCAVAVSIHSFIKRSNVAGEYDDGFFKDIPLLQRRKLLIILLKFTLD